MRAALVALLLLCATVGAAQMDFSQTAKPIVVKDSAAITAINQSLLAMSSGESVGTIYQDATASGTLVVHQPPKKDDSDKDKDDSYEIVLKSKGTSLFRKQLTAELRTKDVSPSGF